MSESLETREHGKQRSSSSSSLMKSPHDQGVRLRGSRHAITYVGLFGILTE